MSTSNFKRVSRIFCFIFVFNLTIGYAEAKYKIKLVSLAMCKVAPDREFKNPPLTLQFSARKADRQTSLIRLEFSITAKEGPVFFGIRGYQVQQSSSKDLFLNLEKIPCNNPLTFQLIKVINLKLTKSCYSIPGNYTADNINIDDFSWILTKAMIGQGKYAYELEVSTTKGVAACVTLICDITKVKQ